MRWTQIGIFAMTEDTVFEFVKDKPKVEGWYWYRNNAEHFSRQRIPIIFHVRDDQINSLEFNELYEKCYGECAEWCGPLQPPN